MKSLFALVAAVFAVALALSAAELQVAVLTTPMAVDGNLSEYAYVGYGWSQPFVVFDRENAVTNGLMEPVGKPFCDLKTQCGVFTDATNLYVAVLAPCDERYPAGAKDGIGVAVSTDGRTVLVAECGTDGKCVVSRIGADGVRKKLDASGVRCGVKINKRSFNAEVAIPYVVLGKKPDGGGAVWKCNIYRTGPSCGGTSSWSPVQGDMFNTDRFGDIVFGKRKEAAAPLAENRDKAAFLWLGERWGGDSATMPPLDEREIEKVSLFGPRGGRAVAHFRVSNLTDRPALYSFTMGDYAKSEFARRIRFREVGNVELKGGPTVSDPIFNLPNGSVLRIPAKTTAMVWVDVDTGGLKPGLHNAALTLVPGYSGFEEKSLALELTVGMVDVRVVDMPCWNYALREARDFRALRDYRFNVSAMMTPTFAPKRKLDGRRDWRNFDDVVESMLGNGTRTNEVRILVYTLFPKWGNPRGKPEIEREFVDNMRAGVAYAKARWGIGLDRIWLSTVDEPHGDPADPKSLASFAFYGAQLAKRIDPGLKAWTNPWNGRDDESRFLPRYLEAFDTLVPYLPTVNRDDPVASERYAGSGKDVWSYTIYLKQNRPMQYRGISWKNFAYGFGGPATFYDLFDMAGDGFSSYDKGGKADYGAVYSDRRTGLVSPSLRLEAWYQGHIEQRLLKWCKARIDAMPDKAKVVAFAARLDSLVKRATAPRVDFDAISRELLTLSDELRRVGCL